MRGGLISCLVCKGDDMTVMSLRRNLVASCEDDSWTFGSGFL